jgi:hypothetical protein
MVRRLRNRSVVAAPVQVALTPFHRSANAPLA